MAIATTMQDSAAPNETTSTTGEKEQGESESMDEIGRNEVNGGHETEERYTAQRTENTNGETAGSWSNGDAVSTASCADARPYQALEKQGADGGAVVLVEPGRAAAQGLTPRAFCWELGQLAKLAWPVVLTQILNYTIGTVAIICAGNKGKTELDVIALATSVLSATAVAVANGLAGYCDTIFAQVFGSDERSKLGAVLQKCLLIILLGICPSLALHVNLMPLLLFMGHDHHVARLSEQYMMILVPGTIAVYIYIVLSKYVQNQNKEIPILIIAILANVVNAVLHAVMFLWLDIGIWISALSQCISYVSLAVFTIIYIIGSGLYKNTWQSWTWESFLSWGTYCKLGAYSLLQHCIEVWAFDLGIVLTGLLGGQMVGAQSIAYQYVLILYTIAWGLGLAGGIRVGQHLGANDPKAARLSSNVTLITAGTIGLFFAILVLALRYQLAYVFTQDAEIVDLVATVLVIISIETIFDFMGGTMNGILRGCGRQAIGTAITTPAFAFVLVCGITLMLKTSLQLKGFWIAVLIALFFQSVIGTFFVCRLDWQIEAQKAQVRIQSSGRLNKDSQQDISSGDIEFATLNGKDKTITKIKLDHENTHESPPSKKLTKKIIFFRVLAYSVSMGSLLVSIFVRCMVHIPAMATHNINNSSTIMSNETENGLPLSYKPG